MGPSSKSQALESLFGTELKRLRFEAGISQEELAFEAGFHRTYISQLERGVKSPTLKTLFSLAEALKVSPVAIVETLVGQSDGVRTKGEKAK